MTNQDKEITIRTKKRQDKKLEMDALINLSNDKKDVYMAKNLRLLDEGFCLWSDNGDVRFYLTKGAHERFLNSLEDGAKIPVKLSHKEESNDPIQAVGYFTKEDLKLVNIDEQGRKALNVDIYLNNSLNCVQDVISLSKESNMSLSAEITCKVDYKTSEELGFRVITDYEMTGVAIVAEGGNASSNGIKLSNEMKGETMSEIKLDNEEVKNEIIEEEKKDEVVENDEVKDEVEDEVENNDEVSEEDDKEEVIEEEDEKVEGTDEKLNSILKSIDELKAQNEKLVKENKSLKAKLSAKDNREKKFFETLSLSINEVVDEREVEENKEELDANLPKDGIMNV